VRTGGFRGSTFRCRPRTQAEVCPGALPGITALDPSESAARFPEQAAHTREVRLAYSLSGDLDRRRQLVADGVFDPGQCPRLIRAFEEVEEDLVSGDDPDRA
jgi:hypothetical protein